MASISPQLPKQAPPISESSPLVLGANDAEDYEESVRFSCCGCFPGFFYRPLQEKNDNAGAGMERSHLMQDQEEMMTTKDGWLVEKVRKLKEMSEVLAGPKWKNFIRRFGNKKRSRTTQYRYDPQSYALNFDDGLERELQDSAYPDFLARYAAPVGVTNGQLTCT